MNRRTKFALWVLPFVVLSMAPVWVKWKTAEPTATSEDLAIRRKLLIADKASLFRNRKLFHVLSSREKSDIAAHLWVILSSEPTGYYTTGLILRWGTANLYSEAIYLGPSSEFDAIETRQPDSLLMLHPATSRYIRDWFTRRFPKS